MGLIRGSHVGDWCTTFEAGEDLVSSSSSGYGSRGNGVREGRDWVMQEFGKERVFCSEQRQNYTNGQTQLYPCSGEMPGLICDVRGSLGLILRPWFAIFCVVY